MAGRINEFFENPYSSEGPRPPMQPAHDIDFIPQIPQESRLLEPFSDMEIWKAVSGLKARKALEPDGLHAIFLPKELEYSG